MTAIAIDRLTKVFTRRLAGPFWSRREERFCAVDHVTLEVAHGEVVGLLGPNGSGKTTLLKMIMGLIHPTSGRVLIHGRRTTTQRHLIGACFGTTMIYHRLTGHANLKFFARLYGVRNYPRRIQELAEWFGLTGWLDTLVERYSLGMRARLALARALVHDPPILILDEPTLGLDPMMAADLRRLISQMDKTILLATHVLDEVDELADRAVVLSHGQMQTVQSRPFCAKELVTASGWRS